MHLPTGVAHFVQQSSAHSYTLAAYMYCTNFYRTPQLTVPTLHAPYFTLYVLYTPLHSTSLTTL